ncbi:MAG TPA: hypothetical protein VH589_24845 [Trebonia sp.]
MISWIPNSTARTSSVSLGQISTTKPAISVRAPYAKTQPQCRPRPVSISVGRSIVSVMV